MATHLNSKSQLNALCSKKVRRPLKKDDIVYTCNKFGNQYQATVRLMYYVEPLEFASELCSTTKAAEQSSAQMAINAAALNDGTFDLAVKAAPAQVKLGQAVAPLPAKAGKLMVSPMAQQQQGSSSPQQQLQFICGSSIGRQMTAADIQYKVVQFEGKYQATVTLRCKGGAEFAGELSTNPATASNNAATQALQHLITEDGNLAATLSAVFGASSAVAALGTRAKPAPAATASKKRKVDGEAGERKKWKSDQPKEDPVPATKSVAEGLEMLLERKPTSLELFYLTEGTEAEGFTSKLSIPCLPGDLSTKQWTGEKLPTKAAAEEDAAFEALSVLTEHKEVGKHFTKAANLVMKSIMKGKGCGKGKGKGAMNQMAGAMMMMNMNMQMNMMMMNMNMGGGWGGGGGGGGKKKETKKATLTDVGQVTGTVKEWKGSFGWITPSKAIEHAEAKKNDGKIYVAKADLSGDLKELVAGKTVKFSVYSDGKGLGAEKVEVQ